MREYEPKTLVCYCLLALCWILGAVFGEHALAQSTQPSLVVKRVGSQSANGVTLRWDKGVPPETTVSNLTTRKAIYAGLADAVMFSGLALGSTNRFQAFNTNTEGMTGFTPVLTTLATTQDLRCTIRLHTYLVTIPMRSNQPTSVMTSTNLQTWYQIALINSTNPTYSFVWTNDGCNRFFRSTSQ